MQRTSEISLDDEFADFPTEGDIAIPIEKGRFVIIRTPEETMLREVLMLLPRPPITEDMPDMWMYCYYDILLDSIIVDRGIRYIVENIKCRQDTLGRDVRVCGLRFA